MGYHGKNGRIAGADYIRFGTGERVLVILPGLGDGLKTVKGMALPMWWMYRMFSKAFTVYLFSRKADLPQGYTTREMAHDLKETMDALGIQKASVLGVSMGGMIAQWLAIDYPETVEKLILAVTSSKPNPILEDAVTEWIHQAAAGDHTALMESNLKKIYSPAYCRKNGWMIPLIGRLTKPKSYHRFLVLAEACLKHNAFPFLSQIRVPTLVIGGELDQALGVAASHELADAIPNAQRKIYPQWGHGLYEEAPDFNGLVYAYLLEDVK